MNFSWKEVSRAVLKKVVSDICRFMTLSTTASLNGSKLKSSRTRPSWLTNRKATLGLMGVFWTQQRPLSVDTRWRISGRATRSLGNPLTSSWDPERWDMSKPIATSILQADLERGTGRERKGEGEGEGAGEREGEKERERGRERERERKGGRGRGRVLTDLP